jgi:predicted homoserine dehydrogenase-like protein
VAYSRNAGIFVQAGIVIFSEWPKSPYREKENEMLRVGLIGLGGMGMHQAKSFAQVMGCRVAAGADPATDMRSRFVQSYPDA